MGNIDRDSSCCSACLVRTTDRYTRTVLAVQGWLNRVMGSVGAFVARRPVIVLILSILAAIACGLGWLRFEMESDADDLWVPQNSKAMKDREYVSSVYKSGGGGAQFMASVNPKYESQYGKNAMQLAIFWEMFQVDAAIRAIVVDKGGKSYTWRDMCEKDSDGNCKYSGPLNLWSMNFTDYLTFVNGSKTDPTAGNRLALVSAVNSVHYPDGRAVSTLSIFGGITLSPRPGVPPLYMSAFKVAACSYSLSELLDDKVESAWYDAFLDVMKEQASKAEHTALAYIADSSVSNEIGASVTADLYLVVVSVLIFIFVAVLGTSRLHVVATRSSLALLGVASAVLAMLAGYGLSLVFDCPFNTLSQTLPYVLLGLAIDCMFILVKAYDGAAVSAPGPSLETRFRDLMSSAGTSVFVTLLASAVAFALGSISELPAVRWFSVYATMGVVCIVVTTFTFFAASFVLTERRIARNRFDCCCCCISSRPRLSTACSTFLAADETTTLTGIPVAPVVGSANGSGPVHAAVVLYPPHPTVSGCVTPQPMGVPVRSSGPVAETVEGSGEGGQQQPQQPSGSPADSSGSSNGRQTRADSPKAAVPSIASGPHSAAATLPAPGAEDEEPNLMKRLFARYYAPALTKWYVKVAVLAVFAGWIVVCCVGIPRLGEGQPLSELAPDTSYLQDYVTITTDTFQQQIGTPTYLYFRYVDPSSPAKQAAMLKALATTLQNPFINSTVSAFQGNWLIDFIGWVQTNRPNVTLVAEDGCSNPFQGRVSGDLGNFIDPPTLRGCVPESEFMPLLLEFLSTHRSYMQDIRFAYKTLPNDDVVPQSIWSSRLPVVHTAKADNGAYGRECIKSIRDLEGEVNDKLFVKDKAFGDFMPGPVFFVYVSDYVYDEGDAIMGRMTLEYVLLAVAGVGLVLLLTLPSLRAVVLMMVAVGLVDFFLFGEMYILGIRFNQVSIINMIMATGLSVDYAVYFAQRFVLVTADGTRNDRMALALADTGSAVFVGGLTALTGTIPLAFSSSTILRTFFALIFGTICFALLVGLMLMPVIFSLVGPPPVAMALEKQRSSESSNGSTGKGGGEGGAASV